MLTNAQVFQRLDRIEYKQLETDKKIDQVFAKLEEKTDRNKQCIFFDGQIYDAYEFICDLIRRANKRIVLIDNYVDDSVLTMLDKRGAGVGQRPWEEWFAVSLMEAQDADAIMLRLEADSSSLR